MSIFFKNWNLIYNSDILWHIYLQYFPCLDSSKYLTELVKPIKLVNCFLGSEIEKVISLNLKTYLCWEATFWMSWLHESTNLQTLTFPTNNNNMMVYDFSNENRSIIKNPKFPDNEIATMWSRWAPCRPTCNYFFFHALHILSFLPYVISPFQITTIAEGLRLYC